MIAVVLMITGIGFLGMLTGSIATFFIGDSKKNDINGDVIDLVKQRLDNFEDLTSKDIDDIHALLKSIKLTNK